MGEFAHGIHVYTNNYKNLIHIVNKILIQNGFEPTDSEECDRCIAVVGTGMWISIFDQYDIYDKNFDKLLSKNISMPCVVLDLMDGDCVQAVLMKDGRKINTYISHPEEFESSRRKSNAGNAKKWVAVTEDIKKLQELFDDTETDANSKLYKIAELLEIDTKLAAMKFNYLEELDDKNIEYLKFKDINKPPISKLPIINWVSSRGPLPIQRQIQGEPGIAAALKAGERITMDIDIINIGEKSKGLTINIVGSIVEDENIVFEYIRVFDAKNIAEKQEYAYESVFKRVDYQDGRKGYSAKIENIELPNSIPFVELMKRRNNMDSFFMFQLQLFGKAVMPTDESDMRVFIHPIENYYDGYICINTTDDFIIIE